MVRQDKGEYNMYKRITAILATACLAALLAAGSAFAAGTDVHLRDISNKATATYKDANNNDKTPVDSNTVVTEVHQVYDVSLAVTTTPLAEIGGNSVVFELTVTNTGNAKDSFTISGGPNSGDFAATTTFWSDFGCTAALQASDTADIAATGSAKFYMKAEIPTGEAGGHKSLDDVTATSVGLSSETDTATCETDVREAHITLAKSVDISTPDPGTVIEFTITATSDGSTTATGVHVTDDLTSMLTIATFVTGTLKVDGGSALTDPGASIDVDLGDMPTSGVGSTHTITFSMKVKATAADTDSASNTASGYYGPDGPKTPTPPGTPPTITVHAPIIAVHKQVSVNGGGFSDGPNSAKPGDILTYRIAATNNGSGNATVVIIADDISSLPVTYEGSSLSASTNGAGSATSDDSTSTMKGQVDVLEPGKVLTVQFQVKVDY